MNFNYNLPVNILFGSGRINDVEKKYLNMAKSIDSNR